VVVEPAVVPTDAQFGKRDNAPMWISFPYRPQFSSASRFTAGAFGFLTFTQCGATTRQLGDIRRNPPRLVPRRRE
jgi:hypothetical protein